MSKIQYSRCFPFRLLIFVHAVLLPWSVGAQSPGNIDSLPIIDVHTHIMGRPMLFSGAIKRAETLIDQYGVRKAIISHVPANDAKVFYKFKALMHFLKGKKRFAFLGGGGTLNPMIHRHDANSLESRNLVDKFTSTAWAIVNGGAAGFGEMASLHISLTAGHAYVYQPADHPLFLRLADIAAESGLPIELHSDGVRGSMNTPDNFSDADNPGVLPGTLAALERLLAHNPKAKISWAHGGSDPLGEMTPRLIHRLMDKHPNLYMSLRIVDSRWPKAENTVFDGDELDKEWLALLKRHSDRFFIGTDAIFLSPNMPKRITAAKFAEQNSDRYEVTRTFLALLPRDIAAKVAYKNAMRVYRPNPRMAARGPSHKGPRRMVQPTPGEKKFFSETEIRETVIGNTINFIAPKSGRRLFVYFSEDGQVLLKFPGAPKTFNKRWSINPKGMLCRTVGRQNRKHCTKVAPTKVPNRLMLMNKKVQYQATVLKGRQLPR